MSPTKIKIPAPTTSHSDVEKRKELRIPLRVLRVKAAMEGDVFFGYARNLSPTGMFIQTPNPKEPGQEVHVRFTLPPKDEEISCRAKIVWARNYLGKNKEEPGMGLTFVDLSVNEAEIIRHFVTKEV